MMSTSSAAPPFDDAVRLRATSAASWGAIFAGAFVAVSVSLILVTLGTGLGFASVSPWPDHGPSASAFGVASTIWLIVTQWISAAAGGYIAGRLRQRWLATHTHEVFFRDTAHGLVTWALATLIVAAILAGSVTGLVGGGARAVGGLARAGGQGAATTLGQAEMPRGRDAMELDPARDTSDAYNLDKLFRGNSSGNATDPDGRERGSSDARGSEARVEALDIAANFALTGAVSDEDRSYLAALVANKTGVARDEAQKRVDTFIQSVREASLQAKAAADAARKSAATAALYASLALLMGAFIASVSAAIGGRLRDDHL